MPYFKVPNETSPHWLDDADVEKWKGEGWEEISEAEAAAMRPQPPAPTVQDQIVALEQANPITHRNLRDLAMAVAALGELVTGQPAANLPMVQAITALEDQIKALRSQL